VHHGYFWRGEDACIRGQKLKRLRLLLSQNISLFAYHLPLDSHVELGNNATLARQLQLVPESRFGENELGWMGRFASSAPMTVTEFAANVEAALGRKPMLIGDPDKLVKKIAWCTGAAQNMLDQAISAGGDVFLSGEISEPTVHLARESGIAYLACGHHATERYGVQALGEHIAQKFGITHHFVDIDNPV
ncbi:MAG: Nif3-like dinuclear metal center hexameric protein, partial [Burkholderiales bacterium]|nr:Nif3-like dinuclear metal center hexameric protein [Burkholderiales bacterium]